MTAMRVLLADDHTLFRQGLKVLFESEKTFEVVGEAADGFQAVELAEELNPDLVIMDISMPGLGGLEATTHIREHHPEAKVIILSRHSDNAYVDQALRAGALGYIHKDAVYDELKLALDAAKKHMPYLSPKVLQNVVKGYINTSSTGAVETYNKLTAREKEICRLLVKNHNRKEIADILMISPKTVDRHRGNILEKLNLRKVEELKELISTE